MLKKSIPVLLALGIGLLAGVILSNPGMVRNAYATLSGLQAVFRLPQRVAEPAAPPEKESRDIVQELLANKDVQAMIKSFLADPKIDIRAVSELVARQIIDSPEIKQALADQTRSQEVRKIMMDMVRSPDFQQAVKDVLQSKDFRLLYEDMIVQVIKEQTAAPKTR